MIPLESISFPYLAVAQHFNVPYGEVLEYVEIIPSLFLQRDQPWQRAAWIAHEREQRRRGK